MRVHGLVLAAGQSKRMGDFKPLMDFNGQTIIETVVTKLLLSGVDEVTIVLGHRGSDIQKCLEKRFTHCLEKLIFAYNEAYASTEMLDSIKIGLRAMSPCERFFLVPGDMPAISVSTYRRLRFEGLGLPAKVVFPTIEGRRKHPPFISWSCREDILAFEGAGLRALWQEYEGHIDEVVLDDLGCTIDLDYQSDYRRALAYIQR